MSKRTKSKLDELKDIEKRESERLSKEISADIDAWTPKQQQNFANACNRMEAEQAENKRNPVPHLIRWFNELSELEDPALATTVSDACQLGKKLALVDPEVANELADKISDALWGLSALRELLRRRSKFYGRMMDAQVMTPRPAKATNERRSCGKE